MTAPGTSRLLALFVSSLPDGAIQQVFVNLANGFVERGHRVRLVAAKFEGERPPDLDGRVSTVNLSARATRTPWVRRRRRRWLPASAPELADFLRRERPDCLLCGGKYANLAGLWARRMAGIPLRVALSEHNPITNTVSNPGRLRVFLPFLVRRFYPLADAVVAVSASVAADLADFARIPRERVTTIPNPVLTRALLERMSEAPERPEWLGAGAPLIVTAARLAPQKDLETLLRAFALLRARRDVRLLILGEGRSRASLEALRRDLQLEHSVRMPGTVPNPLPYMREADIFALSSIYEGFGNVLVEALAAGCKVVSTDCPGGPREILDGGRYGSLVPVGDAPAFARALEAALDTPHDAGKLEARARDFAVESIADAYLERILP